MKKCSRCKETKLISEFNKQKNTKDGLSYCCKTCRKNWRMKNREHSKAYQKTWSLKKKEYLKDYRIKNRNKKAKWEKDYKINSPEKLKAKNKLNKAFINNKIKRPKKCQSCGTKTNIQCHHFDYSKPLEFIPLCASCHQLEHVKLKGEI